MNASEVIELLELEPLEGEGGYFRRTFESEEKIGHRFCGTAIYYLVTPESFSTLHRLPQSELFHFYLGDPVEMIQIKNGALTRVILGTDLKNGQSPQRLVEGNVWQGTRLLPGGKWALLGCTVVPGYEDADNELADASKLVKEFPEHADWIRQFTKN